MEIVENEVLTGMTIAIDEKHFVNCKYKNCAVLYSGGDWAWTNTTFENCHFNFAGPAQRTFALLGNFAMLPPGSVPVGEPVPKRKDGSVH